MGDPKGSLCGNIRSETGTHAENQRYISAPVCLQLCVEAMKMATQQNGSIVVLNLMILEGPPNRHIHVTCAIIEREGLVLTAQRSGVMTLPLKWEFPGGKINQGESFEECLKREILEEMSISIEVGPKLLPHTHRYTSFTVTLYPYLCTIAYGEIILHEHAQVTWLPPERLQELDWAEADLPVIEAYRKHREEIVA